MTIDLIAAEIVTALDTQAKESAINRAEVVKGILLRNGVGPCPAPPSHVFKPKSFGGDHTCPDWDSILQNSMTEVIRCLQ